MENKTKVLLILVDGMRPDSIAACGSSFAAHTLQNCRYQNLHATTVFPSVTLPCHMSLFHSVTPQRHGILTNTYVPMARKVNGLTEVLHAAGKRCAFFYTWEELRDLAAPGSLCESVYATMYEKACPDPEVAVTDAAIHAMQAHAPDFLFLYLGLADETGHHYGWMSKEYLAAVSHAWDSISRAMEAAPACYKILITADHGGHEMNHGSDDPLDMTTPILVPDRGGNDCFREGDAHITDIAPTIVHWLGVSPDPQWIGTSLVL
jgi:predicted AlkP superfamily pyrophosphatase or phosphodiesterase